MRHVASNNESPHLKISETALAFFVALIACLGCQAQSSAPPSASAFDAASICPAAGNVRADIQTSPGSLNTGNQSLLYLIYWACDTPPFQIGGPGWLNESRFDVIAKAAGTVGDTQLRLMLRTLLWMEIWRGLRRPASGRWI